MQRQLSLSFQLRSLKQEKRAEMQFSFQIKIRWK